MSLAKVKVEKTDLEAGSARSRLDAVLQGLLDKNVVDRPSARLSHHRRKKRKEEDGITESSQPKANTFIIRLFDRSVDLAQFSEETPLYPVCRAWLRNAPTARPPEQPQTPPPTDELLGDGVNGNIQNIYHLPPPLPGPVRESGEPMNLRIPSPLPHQEEPLNLNTPPELAPSISSLIYENMNRWKKIRQRWKDASHRNQQRFAQSMKILKEMYERQ
ncbi:protein lin-37 homolog isoform X2 [Xenopus laevis]|uniref:Protein lin-37 homolog isoform X2 n=1 Tax=Xenopus laevis TaxID=8355 RepID=A0A8J0TH45_XENLA|nr:protein lin-37 homolog isoform X2 [Xenopus laevis]